MATLTHTTTAATTLPQLLTDSKRMVDLSRFPKLSKEQAGHLRHFHNLANQPINEWNNMNSEEPLQEFLDAYRYQLATMAYATGAAHYHRLPALRGPMKKLMHDLIQKMLHRAVWGYWFMTSLGGNMLDPSLKEYRKPWADPVIKENIMYSGHLLLMVSLYAMLFDDDEFEREGALTFKWDPMFFGFGTEIFKYDTKRLQDAILKEMEANNWMGVCCEPNAIFVVCNQFPLIAMQYNDSRWDTNIVPGILDKYSQSWKASGGMCGKNGMYRDMWLVKQNIHVDAQEFGFSAWANAFMNSWNTDFVKENTKHQAKGYVVRTHADGRDETVLNPPLVAAEFRSILQDEGPEADTSKVQFEAHKRAKSKSAEQKVPRFPYKKPILGYVMQCMSEVGQEEETQGLFDFVDSRLNPTWDRGGLFYPRNDKPMDEECRWTHVSPFCGNAAIGYARLNIINGQKKMWEQPWSREKVRSEPYLDNVDFSSDVDFLRAFWSDEDEALVVTLRTWHQDIKRTIELKANNLSAGSWQIVVNGRVVDHETLNVRGSVSIPLKVDMDETDVIITMIH